MIYYGLCMLPNWVQHRYIVSKLKNLTNVIGANINMHVTRNILPN